MKLTDISQGTQYSVTKLIETIIDQNTTLCYVFSLSPIGYIIICVHTNLPIVIAYSLTNPYQNSSNENNPLHYLIFSDLTSRLNNINLIPQNIIYDREALWNEYLSAEYSEPLYIEDFQQWPPLGTATYGGWIETTWNQNDPFNKFCPIDLATQTRSIAGCPSIAMAQILNYHQTTNNIIFNDSDDYYHNYSGNNFWIDDDHETYDFPSFPELNNYLGTLEFHYQNHVSSRLPANPGFLNVHNIYQFPR